MIRILIQSLLFLTLSLPLFSQAATQVETGDPSLDQAFSQILDRNNATKLLGIKALANTGHPQAFELLRGMLDGRLRVHKKSSRLVWGEKQGRKFAIVDALNGDDLGLAKKRKVKKLPINNQIRSLIETVFATRNLNHAVAEKRLTSVQSMLANPDPSQTESLRQRLKIETDDEVREALQTALSVVALSDPDPAQRLLAIDVVKDSLHNAIYNRLQALSSNDPDPLVQAAATKALIKMDKQKEFYGFIETLFFGLSAGSVLVLAAIGLAITFGVMGVINMAHGELIMLGAYTTYLIQQALPNHIGLSIGLAIPAAFIVSGLVGIAIERGVIRHLYGRPLETLLATFGISLVLQQLVRTVISPQNVPVENPEFMSGLWQINSLLSLTYNRLYVFLFSLIVFAGLFLVLKKTRLGLQVRAVSQNRAMARAMGVRSSRVDALTFGLGSGIAGIAGVALSQLTNVGPNLGQAYIVDSFMVVVFGGVGNLWGTLIGGMSLGIANKFLEPWAGAVLAKILVLVFIILFIQKRPKGLFPQKGRAAGD